MNTQPAGEQAESSIPQWVWELWDTGALKEPQGVHLLMTRLSGDGQAPEAALRQIVAWLSCLIFMPNSSISPEQSLRLWQEASYLCWRHNLSLSSILLDAEPYSFARF